jgi:hypothetical protein
VLNFAKRAWKDPVWSAVIAAGILALLTGLFNYWSTIAAVAGSVAKFLTSSSLVPNWLIGVAGVISVGVLVVLVSFGGIIVFGKKQASFVESYVTDEFFGLVWRWQYYSSGAIRDLHTFCPTCDYQLYAQEEGAYSSKIAFRCDVCDRKLAQFDEGSAKLKDKVIRLIEQRLRSEIAKSQVKQSR